MKRLLLVLLPLLLIVGCSKPEKMIPLDNESLKDRNGVKYKQNSQEPFSGEVFELHNNGNKKLKGYYKDGLMDGNWIGWYENGQKDWEGSFDGGKTLEKIKFSYDYNGQKLTEDYYDDRDVYIDSKYFNNDGSLKDTVKFEEVKEIRDGRDFLIVSKNTNKPFTGIVKMEKNGTGFISGLKNGKYHGRTLGYENGTLGLLNTYKNHKLDGLMEHKERGRGYFKNGLMVGEWTWFQNIQHYGKSDSIKYENIGELKIIKGGIDLGDGEPSFPFFEDISQKIETYENIDYVLTRYYNGNKVDEISFIEGQRTYKNLEQR